MKSERNNANSRVTELEERISILEKEAATAKQEAIAATQRAERAEEKEQAAAKQEEELIPRVAAIVNIMTGNFSSSGYLIFSIFILFSLLNHFCLLISVEILSSPPDLSGCVRVNALVDSVTSTEEQVSKL